MREVGKARRQLQIEEAAYRLLSERGYGATSMLAIAKEAKASNETLYRWYGGKNELFKTMVENNAGATKAALGEAIKGDADPVAALESVAPLLLSMLLGERVISLNRAAAADETGELGRTIGAAGRDTVFPMIETLVQRGMDCGGLSAVSARAATEWLLSLLIGDQQVRRAIRAMPAPTAAEINARAADAFTAFRKLCSP